MSDTEGRRSGRPAGAGGGRVGQRDSGEPTQPVAASRAAPTQVVTPDTGAPAGIAAPRAVRRLVRRRATIRRVDPWSVLKLSLIFYLCVLAVAMLVLTMFWAIINRIGLLDTLLGFLAELQLEVEVNGGNIARAAFLLGLLNVVLWSGVNVFLAFLYNLVADLIGGLKITLAEEE